MDLTVEITCWPKQLHYNRTAGGAGLKVVANTPVFHERYNYLRTFGTDEKEILAIRRRWLAIRVWRTEVERLLLYNPKLETVSYPREFSAKGPRPHHNESFIDYAALVLRDKWMQTSG